MSTSFPMDPVRWVFADRVSGRAPDDEDRCRMRIALAALALARVPPCRRHVDIGTTGPRAGFSPEFLSRVFEVDC